MNVQITATTDGKFLGHTFDSDENPITLGDDFQVTVEKVLPLPGGTRFCSANYIIDTIEV